VVIQRVKVQTPFAVEFARSSRTRDGAPTLVPVSEGGAQVPAVVLVLDESVTVADARAMLYRRETGRLNDKTAGSRAAWIAKLPGFAGTSTCLYTALRANIRPLTAKKLAELAVCSAAGPAGAERRDGISYLQQQKRRGVKTPLMSAYEKAVLERTCARDLDGARERAAAIQALDQKEIDLAWDLVMRGLERQPEILGDLRGRTGTLLAAAGVVTSVVIGFFATNPSSISRVSEILLLAGFLLALVAVWECSLVLRSLHDKSDTDLDAYVALRRDGAGRAFELRAGAQGPATVEKLYRKYQDQKVSKPYREWRVTLNQGSLRQLRDVANDTDPLSTPDDLTAEVTSFLSLARKSNWLVISRLTKAFNKAAVLFGIQLLLWIAAAVALYLHLHGGGAAAHK